MTSLDTRLTSDGITADLPGFGLIGTKRYNGLGGWNVEFASGKPEHFASKLLAATTDVGDETADYMLLTVACEVARDQRYAGAR